MNPEVSFLTFGGGAPVWIDTADRLGRAAERSRLFTSVDVIDLQALRRDHPEFCSRYESMLRPEVRGFGYWIWKPLLIATALRNSNGYLLYLDGGCRLNLRTSAARRRFREYMEIAESRGAVAMESEHPEWRWNKADTVEHLGLSDDQLEAGQMVGGIVLLRRSSEILDLVDEWLAIALESEHRFLDDSPSSVPEREGFREHRHDQAIFSGLMKLAGIRPIPDETYFEPDWLRAGVDFPIWATRFRGRSDLRLQLRLARKLSPPRSTDLLRWIRRN